MEHDQTALLVTNNCIDTATTIQTEVKVKDRHQKYP